MIEDNHLPDIINLIELVKEIMLIAVNTHEVTVKLIDQLPEVGMRRVGTQQMVHVIVVFVAAILSGSSY